MQVVQNAGIEVEPIYETLWPVLRVFEEFIVYCHFKLDHIEKVDHISLGDRTMWIAMASSSSIIMFWSFKVRMHLKISVALDFSNSRSAPYDYFAWSRFSLGPHWSSTCESDNANIWPNTLQILAVLLEIWCSKSYSSCSFILIEILLPSRQSMVISGYRTDLAKTNYRFDLCSHQDTERCCMSPWRIGPISW